MLDTLIYNILTDLEIILIKESPSWEIHELSFLNNFFLQMVLDSTKPEVVPVVYEHSGMTLESLFFYIEKALDGRKAKSIGIFSDGDSREISLLQGNG